MTRGRAGVFACRLLPGYPMGIPWTYIKAGLSKQLPNLPPHGPTSSLDIADSLHRVSREGSQTTESKVPSKCRRDRRTDHRLMFAQGLTSKSTSDTYTRLTQDPLVLP